MLRMLLPAQERFRAYMLEMEARREATRRRVEEARQAAKERVAQEEAQRCVAGGSGGRGRGK